MAKTLKQIREAGTSLPVGSHSEPVAAPLSQGKAGKRYVTRTSLQKHGRQARSPAYYAEQVVKKVKKEIMKNKRVRTDTGSRANIINTEPDHKMMTGYH